jgi:hypothetical protein
MKIHWRRILPVFGVLLFSFGSYESLAHLPSTRGRYLWWSSIRLDSDPSNKRDSSQKPVCKQNSDGSVDCVSTEPMTMCVYPGWLARSLFLTSLPAFLLGVGIVGGLGRLGVSQVWSFMISMPLLISLWFYFVGSLLDRWRSKRQQTGN